MNSTVHTDGANAPARVAKVTLTALSYLLAAVFVYTSFTKFTGSAVSVRTFDDIGVGQWLRYVTAALELAGAIGLLIPKLTGLAAACLSALLFGAVLSQLFLVTQPSIATPAVLMVLTGLLAWFRRDRIVSVFTRPSRTDPAPGT